VSHFAFGRADHDFNDGLVYGQGRCGTAIYWSKNLKASSFSNCDGSIIGLRVFLKNRTPSLPTLVGGANGGPEIVKMWKDYFKGILNSENSGNGPAESVEHSIDCKENYLGLEMPICYFVSLASLLQKLPLNKAPGPDCIFAEHLLYAVESLRFFSVNCLTCALFTGIYPIPV